MELSVKYPRKGWGYLKIERADLKEENVQTTEIRENICPGNCGKMRSGEKIGNDIFFTN